MSTINKKLKQKENEERYTNTVATLDTIARNRYIQRNTRDLVKEALDVLKDEKGGSIYVRASKCREYVGQLNTKKTNRVAYQDDALAGRINPRDN